MTYNVENPEHAWLDISKSDLKNIKNPLIDLTSTCLRVNATTQIFSMDC